MSSNVVRVYPEGPSETDVKRLRCVVWLELRSLSAFSNVQVTFCQAAFRGMHVPWAISRPRAAGDRLLVRCRDIVDSF
jgi:hypothetical protein